MTALATLIAPLLLAHRYQLCNFSCPEANWTTCRAEKCDARLAEDACSDGSEALIADENGLAVTGPEECEQTWDVPVAGSFAERCDMCMGLLGEAHELWRADGQPGEASTEWSAGTLCSAAAAQMASMLPTFRTCRLHGAACDRVVATARERACPDIFAMLSEPSRAASSSALAARQQELCGALMTGRNGSNVDAATVCPRPRDVGARLMAIAAVVATALFLAQWFGV